MIAWEHSVKQYTTPDRNQLPALLIEGVTMWKGQFRMLEWRIYEVNKMENPKMEKYKEKI